MEKYPSRFSSVSDVFDQLLGKDKPAFIDGGQRTSLQDAIAIIHQAGGIAVLAHPGYYQERLLSILDFFLTVGGDGIEGYYVYSSSFALIGATETNTYIQKLAKKKKLLLTGGSDYHGHFKTVKLGEAQLPLPEFQKVQQKINTIK